MTIASRPQYGEPIARVTKDGMVIALDDFEKFIDELIRAADQGQESSELPLVSLPLSPETAAPSGVVGSVIAYRFSGSVANYLELDGSTYNFDDYPALGALYGGSPGGTFNVDDWRDVPLWGAGAESEGTLTGSDDVDLTHSHAAGTLVADAVGDHTHQVDPPNTTTGVPSATTQTDGTGTAVASDNHTHDLDIAEFTSGDGGGHGHSVSGNTASALGTTDKRPRRAYVRWMIRARH